MEFQPPKGTRDYMQQDAENLQSVVDIVRKVFESFGFSPLFTPAFEDFGLLAAKGGLGEAVKDEIYYFKDKSDRELGLRFDLTMPMVRVVASNPQLKKPFKRYSISMVWRYENPQALRYREFWQADVDTVGSPSLRADVESAAVACECLERLGFKEYYIRLNNRKILQTIFEKLVGPDKVKDAFRIIDKLDKIGMDGVRTELAQKGVPDKEIMRFLKVSGSNKSILTKIRKLYGDGDGVGEIEKLLTIAKEYGIDKRLKLDVSLVRGLDYYTGPLFEIYLGEKVGCGGGGRYDRLIGDIGGQATPATGISLGISRIYEVMRERGMFEAIRKENKAKVFVAAVDESMAPQVLKIARKLRAKGIVVQTDVMGRGLGEQLKYADSEGANFSIVVGKQELESGMFTVKDMKNKTETKVPLSKLGFAVRRKV
jgi:histidyl-tRNA synthetase